MTTQPYPVLDERSLARARRGLFGRFRELSELPDPIPGAVLVVQVGGGWQALPPGAPDGRDPRLVDATVVSLVDTRSRQVRVDVALPSSDPADDFAVTVTFTCTVRRPDQVAAHGVRSVVGVIRDHLIADPKLGSIAEAHHVDDITRARYDLDLRVRAWCSQRPVEIIGMAVRHDTTTVHTPGSLRSHHRTLRDRGHEQDVARRDRRFAAEDVREKTALVRDGVDSVIGLGLSTGDVTPAQAANVLFAGQHQERQDRETLLKILAETGHLGGMSAQRIAELLRDQNGSAAAALLPGLDDPAHATVDAAEAEHRPDGDTPWDDEDDVPPVDDDD